MKHSVSSFFTNIFDEGSSGEAKGIAAVHVSDKE